MKSKKNVLAWVMMTVGIGFLAVAAAMALPYVDTGANAVIEAPRQQVSAQRADSAAVAAPPQAEQPAVVLLPDMPVAQTGANVAVAASTQDLAPLQVSTIVSPELPTAIEIPAIKVKAKVIAVGPGKKVGKSSVEWSSPGKGQVGWHNYSGRLGEAKNLVLNGHNNIQGAVFRKLYTLQAGDLITIASASYV
ncbi:MAG: class F sortase, partial [Anaerolineae bacterium]|nr:class F sortase [Anaerolineae bacterium]